jgi:2,3-bisphosphoglycerate-independent phosphoglycerate mutase
VRSVPYELLSDLIVEGDSKLVLFVIDGLGGLPDPATGLTELETAQTPNLDALAARSVCGLSEPVGAGIAPGSGPGHLALFGYDPIKELVGRGVLSALGVDFALEPTDVAARINFASIDAQGNVTDRRAGRISTDTNRRLVEKLGRVSVPGLRVFLETESEHRAVAVFRAEGLSDALDDTDPQRTGVPAHPVRGSQPTAGLVQQWVDAARETLADEHPANMVLLRGFAKHPDLGTFASRYKLRAAAVALYPMYRGLARLVGMEILETGKTLDDEVATVRERWRDFDYFYVHVKAADAAGEDGDFARKVQVIEDVDRALPGLIDLNPDCLVVTGDHSTPALLKTHSWHPVPFLLQSRWEVPDEVDRFGERTCGRGALGIFPAQAAMQLMLAASLRLTKYGA